MTLDAARFLDQATATLAAAGVESARHDAEALLAHVLGCERHDVRLAEGQLSSSASDEAFRLVARRANREPLQHLTGLVGFRYLDLEIGPGAFVPRPETEVLAGVAIEELRRLQAEGLACPRAVDLCTGSGAVAAAMASEVPGVDVTAVEISEAAMAYAIRNAAPFGVEVRLGDMAEAVDDLASTAQVVTANPPYIPLEAFESVAREARDFDPPGALWSGTDGLDAIRVVAEVAARLLVPGGLVLCEHADVQGESAPAVFAQSGDWQSVQDNRDLAGRPRFVTARRVARHRT